MKLAQSSHCEASSRGPETCSRQRGRKTNSRFPPSSSLESRSLCLPDTPPHGHAGKSVPAGRAPVCQGPVEADLVVRAHGSRACAERDTWPRTVQQKQNRGQGREAARANPALPGTRPGAKMKRAGRAAAQCSSSQRGSFHGHLRGSCTIAQV